MLPFRFVRRSRRAAGPCPTAFAPRLTRLEDRYNPATTNVLTFQTQPPTNTTFTFDGPTQIEAGDFDGDGFADYAAIGSGTTDGTVEVGINNQDRTFSMAILTLPNNGSVSSMGNQPQALAVGDFVSADGTAGPDGLDDIAVAVNTTAPFGGGVVIFRAQGDGTFVASPIISQVGFFNPGALAAGDLNGDGIADLFLTRRDTDFAGNAPREYTVLINNGSGGFQQVQVSGKANINRLDRPTITDVDGDGNADVVAVDAGNSLAFVFWGKGDGTFDDPTSVTVGGRVTTVAAPDLNGDGARDLVVATSNSKTLDVFYQGTPVVPVPGMTAPGNRTFPPTGQTTLAVPGIGIFSPTVTDLVVADFNFDQIDDLAAANNNFGIGGNNQSFPLVNIFLGSPTKSVLPAVGTPLATVVSPQSIVAADFDNNFLPDILVGGDFFNQKYQSFFNDTVIGGLVTVTDSSPIFDVTREAFGSTFYGQSATFTASVSKFIEIPTGTVEFFAGGIRLGASDLDDTGSASVTLTGTELNAGPYVVTAKYSGGNYPDANAGVQHNVLQLQTTSSAVASVTDPVFGQPVTFTADVDVVRPVDARGRPFGPPVTVSPGMETPPAKVGFFDNGNLIGSASVDDAGVAKFTVQRFALGDHPIEAKFLGGVNFGTSTAEFIPLTVDPANSTTALSASPRAVNFGDAVSLKATVRILEPGQGAADGSVRFFSGTTLLAEIPVAADGTAVAQVVPPSAGNADYTAQFVGSDAVAASMSSTARVRVAATVSAAALAVGDERTLADTLPITVSVTDPQGRPVSTGTVTILATRPDGSVVTVVEGLALADGQAVQTVRLFDFGLGETTFAARFEGSDSITPADATTVTINVGRAVPVVTFTNTAGSPSVPLSKDITFTAAFANRGAILTSTPTGTVTFLDNDRPLGTVPLDANGTASFTARLPLGQHTVTARFSGDGLYAAGDFPDLITVVQPIEGFVASSAGNGSDRVAVFNPDGTFNRELFAFGPDTQVGVRVATGDLNGDGVPDIAVGTGPGVQARVRVLDGVTGEPLFEIFPFEDFTGGVFVAIGDANGDLRPDLIITPDQGGGPRVRIFSGNSFGQIADFFGIEDPAFRGGARAAVGDVNADGFGDVIVSAGFGGGPRIAVWDGRGFAAQGLPPRKLFNDFFAFENTLRNGAYVAAGDLDGDGFADLIFGAGPGGAPRVLAMSGLNLANTAGANRTLIANFFAGDINSRGGVPVTARTMDVDGQADTLVDIITGSEDGGGNTVSVFSGSLFRAGPTPIGATRTISVFDDGTNPGGGVFVG